MVWCPHAKVSNLNELARVGGLIGRAELFHVMIMRWHLIDLQVIPQRFKVTPQVATAPSHQGWPTLPESPLLLIAIIVVCCSCHTETCLHIM